MEKINDKYDDYIDKLMKNSARSHNAGLHQELLNKIPLTESYTNSITIAVGKQRSGKTRKIIKEIIKISKMHPETHMLLYCNKTGGKTDKTFESFKSLIQVPIEYVSQENLEQRMQELLEYKRMYDSIVASGVSEVIVDDNIEDIIDNLHVEDFSRPYLHTLVLLDDIANSPLIKKETSYLNSLMTQCAHINCSFFLAVQYWKGLTSSLKSQCAVCYLFGEFPAQQVRYILQQAPVSDPFDVVWSKYKELKARDFMTIDIIAGEYTITLAKEQAKHEMMDSETKKIAMKQIKSKPRKKEGSDDEKNDLVDLAAELGDEGINAEPLDINTYMHPKPGKSFNNILHPQVPRNGPGMWTGGVSQSSTQPVSRPAPNAWNAGWL